jgi:hypothetical protein
MVQLRSKDLFLGLIAGTGSANNAIRDSIISNSLSEIMNMSLYDDCSSKQYLTLIKPLLLTPYRRFKCRVCRMELSAQLFYSKSAGTEGPFPHLWSKKETICKCCCLSRKAKIYKQNNQRKAELTNRRKKLNTLDITTFSVIVRPPKINNKKRELIYEEIIELLL